MTKNTETGPAHPAGCGLADQQKRQRKTQNKQTRFYDYKCFSLLWFQLRKVRYMIRSGVEGGWGRGPEDTPLICLPVLHSGTPGRFQLLLKSKQRSRDLLVDDFFGCF